MPIFNLFILIELKDSNVYHFEVKINSKVFKIK